MYVRLNHIYFSAENMTYAKPFSICVSLNKDILPRLESCYHTQDILHWTDNITEFPICKVSQFPNDFYSGLLNPGPIQDSYIVFESHVS